MSECIGPRLALPTTRLSEAGRLPPRSNRGGPTRTCAYVLDEVALRPDHDGSAHNAENVSRSPTSGMRSASESWGCWARRTDPAMATAGCQMSSTSRAAGSAEGSEPHWHPGSCCISSIGTPPSPRSRPTSVRGRATLTGFEEARGCRRQLRGCDGPENLGQSLKLEPAQFTPGSFRQSRETNALPGIFLNLGGNT